MIFPSLLTPLASLLLNWQRILVYAALIAAAALTVWMHGYFKGKAALYEYQADQAREGARVVIKQGQVTERVVTKYVERKAKTQVVVETIYKEVERYADRNPGTCLDPDWRRLHDSAALNSVPGPAPEPDGKGRAPTAAEALAGVTASYAACHRTADRLDALQEWVEGQRAIAR